VHIDLIKCNVVDVYLIRKKLRRSKNW